MELALTEKRILRFWKKVHRRKPKQCWPWIGAKLLSGYGSYWIGRNPQRAHRVSWTIHNGPIPKGKLVCHHCDTPLCVNPAHLFLGTDYDNRQDAIRKGRWRMAGEYHSNVKLNTAQVLAIRRKPHAKVKALAKQYGVTRFAIEAIRYRKSWKHLPAENHPK